MPSGKNWFNFLYVNLAFFIYIIGIYYLISIQDIKANWSLYRCNPMYMPLSDNIQNDFTYCVQNMQSNFMGYLLQPLTYLTASITGTLGGFVGEINMVRAMFFKIRSFIATIFQTIFGVFLNMVIEFQKVTISIRDLMGKTIGILTTVMYTLDGSVKTMNSTWNGPPGQMVRALGKCFHPETLVKLRNGTIVPMKNIRLGDTLENGSKVEATMQIDNKTDETAFYIIKGKGVNKSDIYVTGSHLIYDDSLGKYVTVDKCSYAEKTEVIHDWFSCLITDNHKIVVGSQMFWDWEDHSMKELINKTAILERYKKL
jgi:hypothetical protein